MRIGKIKAPHFGRLKDFQCDIDAPLVVIKGRNESGKSTTFELLLTLLFGFYNAGTKRTFKPLPKVMSWAGQAPLVEGRLCYDDGQSIDVSRQIEAGKPSAYYIQHNKSIPIVEAQALPQLSAMDRETFTKMYALSLKEMANIKAEWDDVRERLLGGLYPSFLKSWQTIDKDMDKKIKTVWRRERPNNISREIEKNIREAKRAISELRLAQQNMREIEDESDQYKQKLDNLEKERRVLAKKLENTRRDNAIKTSLEQIQMLERKAGDPSGYKDIPNHPMEWLDQQQKEIADAKEKVSAINAHIEQQMHDVQQYSDKHQLINKNEAQIRSLALKYQHYRSIEAKRVELLERSAKADQAIQRQAEELLLQPLADGWRDRVSSLDMASLKSVVDAYEAINRERLALLQTQEGHRETRQPRILWGAVSGGVLIIGGVLIALLSHSAVTKALGAVLGVSGAIAFLVSILKKRGGKSLDEADRRQGEIEEQSRNVKVRWQTLLRAIPLPKERLENPAAAFYHQLSQLRERIKEADDNVGALMDVEQRQKAMADAITGAARSILGASNGVDLDIKYLEDALHRARQAQQKHNEASIKIEAKKAQAVEAKQKHIKAEKAIEALHTQLYPLGGHTLEENIQLLIEKRDAAREARRKREDLRVQYRDYENLESRIVALMDNGWVDESQQNEEELERIYEDIRKTRDRIVQLSTELELKSKETVTPADMEAELLALQEDKAQRMQKRDQMMLALEIIRTSRDRFMEKNRPAFLKLAEGYLSTITGGKYRRIALDESGEDFVVHLEGGQQARGTAEIAGKLSQGTLEQVYLALRLSMLDSLDPGGERLPLLLDEALVNWDAGRLSNFTNVLKDIIKERQVILLTCHDYMAEQMIAGGLKPLVVEI